MYFKPYFENIQTTKLKSNVHETVNVDWKINLGGLYKHFKVSAT